MNSFPNGSAGVEPGIQLTNYMPYHTYIEYTLFTIRRGIQHTPMYVHMYKIMESTRVLYVYVI